jgi:glycosyltransferase involved in cell wall biosynthesis
MANPLRVGLTLEQCWHRVPGGTATSALSLASALDARDDVAVVGIAARHRRPPAAGWQPTIDVVNVPVPRPPLYECWHHLRWPHVEDSTGPLDVVHATGMAVPPTRGPLVVTVHDLAFIRYPEQPTRRGLRFFRMSLEQTRRHADLIHCPSQATADDCLAYGFESERVRVVPWGLDWDVASDEAVAAVRRRHGLTGRYVLFAGTLEPRKNLPRLIEAFGSLDEPDVSLVLVGPEGWGDQVTGVDGTRIRALGFVPPAELAPLYRGAAVFCYPSLLEGFGLPVLEAMSQGTPTVTSANTATAEVGGGAVRAVDPTDVAALAEALSDLLGDPTEARRLGEAGLARSQAFGWGDMAGSFRDLYRELVG